MSVISSVGKPIVLHLSKSSCPVNKNLLQMWQLVKLPTVIGCHGLFVCVGDNSGHGCEGDNCCGPGSQILQTRPPTWLAAILRSLPCWQRQVSKHQSHNSKHWILPWFRKVICFAYCCFIHTELPYDNNSLFYFHSL